jgi:tRNA dimethylallyltransferase
MIENGAISECEAYMQNVSQNSSLPSSKALGARQLAEYVRGMMTLEAAVESAVIETRQFAKRQRTWIRNQMKDWKTIRATAEMEIP